jgi:hypothetical protein
VRKFFKTAIVLLSVASLSACYHVQVETGLPANGQTITRPWANSFIAGLVPPPVLETAQRCPGGVAKVETQHSLPNVLAALITQGIYTPVTITVACAGAAGRSDDAATIDAQNLSGESLAAAFNAAAERAKKTGEPVTVRMR